MIRSMNKYAFLVFHSDYEGFLHKLRSLGVLHVNEQKDSREVEELRSILSERTHIKDTLRALRPYITDGAAELSQPIKNEAEGEALISEIEGELKRLSVQDEELAALRLEATEVRPWGAFDPAAISQLSDAGYALSFFTIPQARFTEAFQAEYDVVPVATLSGRVYFVHLHAAGASQTLPEAEHVATPNVALQNSRDL